jgi:regulator of RNase E activity RraA
MAARMVRLGAKGVLVDGRVRDLETLGGLGIPVSTNGGGAVSWAEGGGRGGVGVMADLCVSTDLVQGDVDCGSGCADQGMGVQCAH